MKVLGIITEYNPFHNGHIYHIEKSKQITQADFVIAVMSGSFTEQGNISIYDKFKRATIAVENGVDLILELPTIYANSSSEYFANASISLLNSINIVDCICFGSEAGNIDLLSNISNKIINNEDRIWKDISSNLKQGISFAKAREQSIAKYLNTEEIIEFSKPNNILAIEYLNSLSKLNGKIKPYTINRNSSNFNDINISKDKIYTSATSIRNHIYEKKEISDLKSLIPQNMLNIVCNIEPTFNDKLLNILKYKIITSSKKDLSNIYEVTEGLENRIISAISNSNTYDELIENIKSKRYQMSKIKRILNNIILNITKDDFERIYKSNEQYAHILKISKRGKALLSQIAKNSNIPLITSVNDNVLNSLSDIQRSMINIDILATNIHSILNNENINKDYTNRL